ncbi:ATP-binding protein [Streptomyces iconiensis]|uniref:ATP-binding protein n=1 Tax=Streptomyces iconiensis TaxID=1384038 RepID=A0ABT7AA00_9ACTN|nr:ATP-binding protein [Streptomyces iconiensis]MDJ1137428.1 ATP-binding protein [Streptomyces iconiensis]
MTTAPARLWAYTLRLPNDPRAPRVARGTVRGVLPLYGLEALADSAELLTSELVTNAVRHTRGPAALRLKGDGERMRIGVSDSDPHIPPPFDGSPGPCAGATVPGVPEGGRGLTLVRLCAHEWGGFPLGDPALGTQGKFLWCDLTLRREDFGIAA